MKRSLPPLVLACTLAACTDRAPVATPTLPPKAEAGVASPEKGASAKPGESALTVYSADYDALARGQEQGGYALVQRDLRYDLGTGENSVTIGRLPRAIDVAAVTFQPQTPGVAVGAQRFIAPLGPEGILARALGRRVAIEHTSGGAKQTDGGTLVSIDNGLTVALPDGRYKMIREYDNLSVLDADDLPAAEPQMRWQVQAQKSGPATFRLAYPTGGLAWRAEYVARLAQGQGCTLAMDGWAMVANRSGVSYPNVALTLVAGEPNRVPRDGGGPEMHMRAQVQDAAAAAPREPEQRASGEYRAYQLPGRSQLVNGSVERVPLFARVPGVACTRTYVTEPQVGLWQPPRPLVQADLNNDTGPQPVKAAVSLKNTKDAGLGQPLPAGRVRVFDGADFLGESQLAHTSVGTDIRLQVGTAFDLSAERERTDFTLDRSARQMTESFAITLRNAKQVDASITVAEPLPRWTEWELVESSVPGQKRDAQHVEFQVPVPAGGETRLTYTVRYRWAEGMKP